MSNRRMKTRPHLARKVLALLLILALAVPVSAFASVQQLAEDSTQPGKSLAGMYPAYTDID